jgi:hypothetical protein
MLNQSTPKLTYTNVVDLNLVDLNLNQSTPKLTYPNELKPTNVNQSTPKLTYKTSFNLLVTPITPLLKPITITECNITPLVL